VKRYKFQSVLHAILPRNDAPPVLIQQNGAAASLEWAIKNRKTWASKGIIKANEKLLDCQLIDLNGKMSLFYLTKVEEVYNCVVFNLEDESCVEKADTIRRIELKRRSEDLAGHAVVHYKNNAYLLTLCMFEFFCSKLYFYLFPSCFYDIKIKAYFRVTW